MLLGNPLMAKNKKPEPAAEVNEGGPGSEYTEPIKVPLWFKQCLEEIAQEVNHQRKRTDKSTRKLPLGYFVVKQMGDWVKLTAEELGRQ